jgi:PAS domain S-box-containing protein
MSMSLEEAMADKTSRAEGTMVPADALAASEARFRALLDNIPLPTLIYDTETLEYLAVNQAALDLYGYDRAEFLAMKVTDSRPPDEVPRLLETLKASAAGTQKLGIWRHRRKDGTVLEMDIISRATLERGRNARLVICTDVTERRRAERAMREKIGRAQQLARVGSWEWNPDTGEVRVSAETYRMLGVPPDTTPSPKAWFSMVHPDDRPRLKRALVAAARGGPIDLEMRFQLPKGQLIGHARGELSRAGGARKFFGTLQDVTDRRLLEQAVRESQAALYRIAEAANTSGSLEEMLRSIHGIVSELMHAPNFYIALYDAAAQTLEFPYFIDEYGDLPVGPEPLGKGVTAYVLRTGQPLVIPDRSAMEALIHSGEIAQLGALSLSWVGVPLVSHDRAVGVLAAQIYAGPVRYGAREKELLQFVSTQVAHAIERKQAEQSLRASERRFRALIESTSDGIFLLGADGNILDSSPSGARMLGLAPGGARGALQNRLRPENSALLKRTLEEAARRPGDPVLAQARIRRRDGTSAVLDAVFTNLLADPAVGGIVVNVRDITDRKQMEAKLMMADRMVSVGTLAAGVAHEINNPLAYVLANLAYLDSSLPLLLKSQNPELVEALREALEGAGRVRSIVRDLKTFSRADEIDHGPVDLHRVLDATANMAWTEIRHRARLVKDYAPDLRPVPGNESRLGQVFLNLIINAAQAIPEGTADRNEIRLITRLTGDRVVIEVRDTGPGISPEVRGRLFDPFFTTKPVGVGTGLGLFICQSIVRSMGGEISVESEPGQGAVFRVSLPLASRKEKLPPAKAPSEDAPPKDAPPEDAPPKDAPPEDAPPKDAPPKDAPPKDAPPKDAPPKDAPPKDAPPEDAPRAARVLVVDDEKMIGVALRRGLIGHQVTSETSAVAALARLRKGERFDVILCDVMMPEMNGARFHELLHAEVPEIAQQLVFMTGGAFTEQARDFLERVPNQRLEKPLDLLDVRALIQTMLQAR